MHSHSPVLMMGGYRPSPEPNFFDRFDRKEQTGLGGRNKTFASPPLLGGVDVQAMANMYGQLPPPHQQGGGGGGWYSPALTGAVDGGSPLHHGMGGPIGGARHGGGHMPPVEGYGGGYGGGGGPLGGPMHPPALSEYDMLLLKGIRPPGQLGPAPLIPPPSSPSAAARTFHTSALLDLSHTGNGMLPSGGGTGVGGGDDFFEQVAQLRSSHGTHLQLTNGTTEEVNVYGTPLNTAKQRQLELLRRPSFHQVEPLPAVGGYYAQPPQQHLVNSSFPPQIASPHFMLVGQQQQQQQQHPHFMAQQHQQMLPQRVLPQQQRQQKQQQRVLGGGGGGGGALGRQRAVDSGESIYSLPIASASPPKPLLVLSGGMGSGALGAKGLSTQEASEIQTQLHSLRRHDAELEAHDQQEAPLAPLRLRKEPSPAMNPITGAVSFPPTNMAGGARNQPMRPNLYEYRQQQQQQHQEQPELGIYGNGHQQQHLSAGRAPSVSPARSNPGGHIPTVPSPMRGTAGLPANAIIAGGPPGLLDDIFLKFSAMAEAERAMLQVKYGKSPKRGAHISARNKAGAAHSEGSKPRQARGAQSKFSKKR